MTAWTGEKLGGHRWGHSPNPETVGTFDDQNTAVAWRDELRALGVEAVCVADHPLDWGGRGDIYLVVAPNQWSRANEILENLD